MDDYPHSLIYSITTPLTTSIILANTIIILGIAWNPQLHNTSSYFFISLLVADICMSLALPNVALMGLERNLSLSSCLVAHVVPNFLFLAFVFNLVIVHYDRYICIINPLRCNTLWMHRTFPLTLVVVWVGPLLFASLPAFGWNNWTSDQNTIPLSNCSNNGTSCCVYSRIFPKIFVVLEVYVILLPAILSIAVMTGHVLWITRGQLKDICRLHRSVERGNRPSDRKQRINLRYIRSMVVMSLTFLICWLPYLIYMHLSIAFLISHTTWNTTSHIALSCSSIGGLIMLPLVLGIANRQYTKSAWKLFQKVRDRWCRRTQGSSDVAV